jgi:GntR family transcriptional regulator
MPTIPHPQRLDNRSPVPLHRQLRSALVGAIATGRYRPGERIPSERLLCRVYGVSRTTVRQTVNELVQEGHLVRVPAKGTFVAIPKIEQDLARVSRFSETVAAAGHMPTVRVLSVREIAPSEEVARALELSPGERVIRIDVLGCADTDPLVLYRVHLRAAWGAPIARDLLRAQAEGAASFGMILERLHTDQGLAPAWAVQSYEAGVADDGTAALLGIAAGAPVFLSTRTIHTAEGVPIEHDEVVYRGDKYRFTIRRLYS